MLSAFKISAKLALGFSDTPINWGINCWMVQLSGVKFTSSKLLHILVRTLYNGLSFSVTWERLDFFSSTSLTLEMILTRFELSHMYQMNLLLHQL